MLQLLFNLKMNSSVQRCIFFSSLFVIFFFCLTTSVHAEQQPRIAVLYPDAPPPYNKVFNAIISGIKESSTFATELYPLTMTTNQDDLKSWLDKRRISGIIALGKQGYIAAKYLETDRPIIVGALRVLPTNQSGISLAADPAQLFNQLDTLSPEVKRIFVVYSADRNDWIIDLAQHAAEHHKLELITYPVNDLRQAVRHYRDILKQIRSKNDAIWLPMDPIAANEKVVLPLLLQKSWDKDLVLISSTPSHVQRGALFSLYPDNTGLGRNLASMLSTTMTSNTEQGIRPLESLNLAVNLRTAAHLGLSFSSSQIKQFTLTFPTH